MEWLGTLLGGTLGFAAAVIPEVLSVAKQHYQSQILKQQRELQLQAQASGTSFQSTDAVVDALLARQEIYAPRADEFVTVQLLRATLRPIVTYLFFALFAMIKVVAMYHALLVDQTRAIDLLPILWDGETNALFAAIITFWFGTRAINWARNSGSLRVSNVTTDGEK